MVLEQVEKYIKLHHELLGSYDPLHLPLQQRAEPCKTHSEKNARKYHQKAILLTCENYKLCSVIHGFCNYLCTPSAPAYKQTTVKSYEIQRVCKIITTYVCTVHDHLPDARSNNAN